MLMASHHHLTVLSVQVVVFLHAVSFFIATFFLPLYYQLLGSNAIMAGIRTLPFSLGSSLTSIIGGVSVAKTGRYKEIIVASFVLYTVGMGTMILLDDTSSVAEQTVTTLVASLGVGRTSWTYSGACGGITAE